MAGKKGDNKEGEHHYSTHPADRNPWGSSHDSAVSSRERTTASEDHASSPGPPSQVDSKSHKEGKRTKKASFAEVPSYISDETKVHGDTVKEHSKSSDQGEEWEERKKLLDDANEVFSAFEKAYSSKGGKRGKTLRSIGEEIKSRWTSSGISGSTTGKLVREWKREWLKTLQTVEITMLSLKDLSREDTRKFSDMETRLGRHAVGDMKKIIQKSGLSRQESSSFLPLGEDFWEYNSTAVHWSSLVNQMYEETTFHDDPDDSETGTKGSSVLSTAAAVAAVPAALYGLYRLSSKDTQSAISDWIFGH